MYMITVLYLEFIGRLKPVGKSEAQERSFHSIFDALGYWVESVRMRREIYIPKYLAGILRIRRTELGIFVNKEWRKDSGFSFKTRRSICRCADAWTRQEMALWKFYRENFQMRKKHEEMTILYSNCYTRKFPDVKILNLVAILYDYTNILQIRI